MLQHPLEPEIKSSWFSLSVDLITSWAPSLSFAQLIHSYSYTEVLGRSFKEHPGGLQLSFSFQIRQHNCLPKKFGSHLLLSASGPGKSLSSLWEHSAHQGLLGPQKREMRKWGKLPVFLACQNGESDRAAKTLTFRKGKGHSRKVRTGKHRYKACKDARESLK